jgi:hypothetical protein
MKIVLRRRRLSNCIRVMIYEVMDDFGSTKMAAGDCTFIREII